MCPAEEAARHPARSEAPESRWELSRQALETLLACLDEDREQAARRYEEIRARLIRFFEWRGLEGGEDLADETIDRVARRLHGSVVLENPDPLGYFMGTAKLIFKEVVRKERRRRTAHPGWSSSSLDPGGEDIAHRRLECLKSCLSLLPSHRQQLILEYYRGDARSQSGIRLRLAQEMSLSLNGLRLRAHRLRIRLEECVQRCLEAAANSADTPKRAEEEPPRGVLAR